MVPMSRFVCRWKDRGFIDHSEGNPLTVERGFPLVRAKAAELGTMVQRACRQRRVGMFAEVNTRRHVLCLDW